MYDLCAHVSKSGQAFFSTLQNFNNDYSDINKYTCFNWQVYTYDMKHGYTHINIMMIDEILFSRLR